MARLIEGPLTIRSRGEDARLPTLPRPPPKLHKFEDTDLEKCVGCSLCAAACPADCIGVVAAEHPRRAGLGRRALHRGIEINLSRCIFCGYCEIACPFDAITMGHDYELADWAATP